MKPNETELCPGIQALFRPANEHHWAGGPLVLTFTVINRSSGNFHLCMGGDRARMRPAFFSFKAFFDAGFKTKISDPLKDLINIGGPVSRFEIKPGETNAQTIVLNQFLSLEKVYALLKDKQTGILTIHCRHALADAYNIIEEATHKKSGKTGIEQILEIRITRNDRELKKQIQGLTTALHEKWHENYSDEADLLLEQLVSIRVPLIIPYLESLKAHPNQNIQGRVLPVLQMLKKQFELQDGKK